jgi:hypothetical protein
MGNDDPVFRSEYDHLNEGNPVQVGISWDDLADNIVAQNYGLVRFLAALVRARQRQNVVRPRRSPDALLQRLIAVINEGLF